MSKNELKIEAIQTSINQLSKLLFRTDDEKAKVRLEKEIVQLNKQQFELTYSMKVHDSTKGNGQRKRKECKFGVKAKCN